MRLTELKEILKTLKTDITFVEYFKNKEVLKMTNKEYIAINRVLDKYGDIMEYDFTCDEVLDAEVCKEVEGMTLAEFEYYFYTNGIFEVSRNEYENNVIWDYVEYVMNELDFNSTEELENIDEVIEMLGEKLIFEYDFRQLCKNSGIELK